MAARMNNIADKARRRNVGPNLDVGGPGREGPRDSDEWSKYQKKVVLPPRNSFHFWQPFAELAVLVMFVGGLSIYLTFFHKHVDAPIHCSARIDKAFWNQLVPSHESWQRIVNTIAHEAMHTKGTQAKATAVVMMGPDEEALTLAAQELKATFPNACMDCILLEHVQERLDIRGMSQLELRIVHVLSKCPFGVIIIDGLHHIPHELIHPLGEGISVRGNVGAVAAYHSLFVFTMPAPKTVTKWATAETFWKAGHEHLNDHLIHSYGEEPAKLREAVETVKSLRAGQMMADSLPDVARWVATFEKSIDFIVHVP